MKEAFEKIKERLEEKKLEHAIDGRQYGSDGFYNLESDQRNVMQGIQEALSIVSEVEAEYGNGWIPCGERLPENDDDVLVWYEFKVMQGTHVGERVERYGVGWFYKRTKSWLVDTTHDVDCRVIAWMPLPSPYNPTTD